MRRDPQHKHSALQGTPQRGLGDTHSLGVGAGGGESRRRPSPSPSSGSYRQGEEGPSLVDEGGANKSPPSVGTGIVNPLAAGAVATTAAYVLGSLVLAVTSGREGSGSSVTWAASPTSSVVVSPPPQNLRTSNMSVVAWRWAEPLFVGQQ